MQKWQKLIILVAAGVDQITKFLVRNNLFLHESREVTGFLSLTYVQNTGVSFGLFQRGQLGNVIFIFISIAVIIVIAVNKNAFEERGGPCAAAGIPLILGGAIGNLIDRIMLGSVVDFIDFHFFPIFNAADSCITVGGALLFFSIILPKRGMRKNVS